MYLVGMKQYPLWFMSAMLIAGCHNQTDPQDLPSVSWQPLDSIFTYCLEKDGDHTFKSGDLLGIAFIGGIDKKSHKFVPVTQGDSAYAATVTKIAENLLSKSLNNKIRKNAEGYIKADLSRLFPDQQVVITAYIRETKVDGGLDTLTRHISEMPEISKQYYISKEEAKNDR